jgi:hypothetical protein
MVEPDLRVAPSRLPVLCKEQTGCGTLEQGGWRSRLIPWYELDTIGGGLLSFDPSAPRDDQQQTETPCPRCGGRDVVLTAFTWGGERQLQWRCTTCDGAWVTPDRRVAERRRTVGEHRYVADDRRMKSRRLLGERDSTPDV